MRLMAALREHEDLGLRRAAAYAVDLSEGSVLVIDPLRRQYGAPQLRKDTFD